MKKKRRKKRQPFVAAILSEPKLPAARFRWVPLVFGVGAALNTIAAVLFLAAALGDDLDKATAKTVYFVLFGTAFIPFGQAAWESARLGLNADEESDWSVRQRAKNRWKLVLRRTPIASSFMLLLFLSAVATLVLGGVTGIEVGHGNGGLEGNLHGATRANRISMAVIAIFFCYVPIYVNAFVVPKCGDLAKR